MKCGLSVVKVRREIVQLRERVEIKGSSHQSAHAVGVSGGRSRLLVKENFSVGFENNGSCEMCLSFRDNLALN